MLMLVEPVMLKYCINRYKTQEMCNKNIDFCLTALKIVSDWFVLTKMPENVDDTVLSNDDIGFGDIESDTVTLFSNAPGLVNEDLDNINLGDDNFQEDDTANVTLVKLTAQQSRFKQRKACEKRQEKNQCQQHGIEEERGIGI